MIDHKYILGILFLLFAAGILLYAAYAGLILIFSLIIFGALSSFWKEKELKLLALAAIVLLANREYGSKRDEIRNRLQRWNKNPCNPGSPLPPRPRWARWWT